MYLTIILLVLNSFLIYRAILYHPYQSLYFNIFVPSNVKNNVDVDYTGLSAYHFLKKLIDDEKVNKPVKVAVNSWHPLWRMLNLFSKDEKHIDKLLQFLEKHITKKKVRRTKKGGCGKGGGKKGGVSKKNKYISNATLKSLQKLSYHDLRNLSSNELQKYKKRVGIIDQEGNPFTGEDLIRMLRKYTSGNKIKTKQQTWRAHQHEKIKKNKII